MSGYRDIFDELTPDERVHMLNGADEEHYLMGQSILTEGQPNQAIYVIVDGLVRVSRANVHLTNLGLGNIFGEMAFLTSEAASASVSAVQETTVLRIDHEHIAELIAEKPDFGTRFFRSLAGTLAMRLKHTSAKVR